MKMMKDLLHFVWALVVGKWGKCRIGRDQDLAMC